MILYCNDCEEKMDIIREDSYIEGDLKAIDYTFKCNNCSETTHIYHEEKL